MRLLVLADTPFAPPTAGNRRRVHDMIAFLRARGATVGMLLLPAADRAEWDVPAMRAALDHLEIADDLPIRPAGPGLVRRLVPALPLPLDAWCPPAFRARAAQLAADWSADVVLAVYVYLSAALPEVRRAAAGPLRTVIDTQDLMHRRRAAYAAAGLPAQWFHTTRARERRGLARADLVLAIQDDDAAVLRGLVPGRSVLTVPHAQPVTPAPPEAARPHRLLLVASYNDLNVVGLRWLLDAVWPQMRRAVPDAELVVCGNVVEKMTARPAGVAFRGVVPALDAEYAAARVVLVAVPSGTGLKVKLVEALCHGRPVVATPAGAAGVATGAAAGVFLGATADAFAEQVRRLLAHPPAWRAAVTAATAHARRRFAPDVAFDPLWRALVSP